MQFFFLFCEMRFHVHSLNSHSLYSQGWLWPSKPSASTSTPSSWKFGTQNFLYAGQACYQQSPSPSPKLQLRKITTMTTWIRRHCPAVPSGDTCAIKQGTEKMNWSKNGVLCTVLLLFIVKRHLDQDNFYKRKHLTGGLLTVSKS